MLLCRFYLSAFIVEFELVQTTPTYFFQAAAADSLLSQSVGPVIFSDTNYTATTSQI